MRRQCRAPIGTTPIGTTPNGTTPNGTTGNSSVILSEGRSPKSKDARKHSASSPIQHVVLVIQENRTFNNFFATYPGADGSTTGEVAPNSYCGFASEQAIKLKESGLITNYGSPPAPHDLTHEYNNGYRIARDNGAMDGFDLIKFDNGAGLPECTFPYQYTNPKDIKPYWDMAKQYTLAEHMFTTQGSSSFTAHQDLIAGDTVISANQALVDLPSCSGGKCIWGCDAPKSTHTSLITSDDQYEAGKGPFPCLTYPTIRDSLDAKSVTWRYYVPQMCCSAFGKLLSAFDAIKAVRYGSEWGDGHISTPQTNIFTDITNNQLQAVSWVIPDENALRPSRHQFRHRPVVGGQRRQRDRRELVLELDGHHYRVGRLGRSLR